MANDDNNSKANKKVNRMASMCKRRAGLLRKAQELVDRFDMNVALVVTRADGKKMRELYSPRLVPLLGSDSVHGDALRKLISSAKAASSNKHDTTDDDDGDDDEQVVKRPRNKKKRDSSKTKTKLQVVVEKGKTQKKKKPRVSRE